MVLARKKKKRKKIVFTRWRRLFFHFPLPTFKNQLHSPAFNYLQDLDEFHPAKVADLLLNIDKYVGVNLTFV